MSLSKEAGSGRVPSSPQLFGMESPIYAQTVRPTATKSGTVTHVGGGSSVFPWSAMPP